MTPSLSPWWKRAWQKIQETPRGLRVFAVLLLVFAVLPLGGGTYALWSAELDYLTMNARMGIFPKNVVVKHEMDGGFDVLDQNRYTISAQTISYPKAVSGFKQVQMEFLSPTLRQPTTQQFEITYWAGDNCHSGSLPGNGAVLISKWKYDGNGNFTPDESETFPTFGRITSGSLTRVCTQIKAVGTVKEFRYSIDNNFRIRSLPPATWTGDTVTYTTEHRVGYPHLTAPLNDPDNAAWVPIRFGVVDQLDMPNLSLFYSRFLWAWPDSATYGVSGGIDVSPAGIDYFALMYKENLSDPWSIFVTDDEVQCYGFDSRGKVTTTRCSPDRLPPSARAIEIKNGNIVPKRSTVYVKVRAYIDSGKGYIDSNYYTYSKGVAGFPHLLTIDQWTGVSDPGFYYYHQDSINNNPDPQGPRPRSLLFTRSLEGSMAETACKKTVVIDGVEQEVPCDEENPGEPSPSQSVSPSPTASSPSREPSSGNTPSTGSTPTPSGNNPAPTLPSVPTGVPTVPTSAPTSAPTGVPTGAAWPTMPTVPSQGE